MGNASSRKDKQSRPETEKSPPAVQGPWMRMRTGLLVVTTVSLILAVFVGWQIYPAGGLGQAVLYGGGFGFSIWFVFYVTFRLNRWLKRR